jgi:hypothetical protein
VLDGVVPSVRPMIFASILDSLQDVTSVVFAVLAFAGLFLLLKGLERV